MVVVEDKFAKVCLEAGVALWVQGQDYNRSLEVEVVEVGALVDVFVVVIVAEIEVIVIVVVELVLVIVEVAFVIL